MYGLSGEGNLTVTALSPTNGTVSLVSLGVDADLVVPSSLVTPPSPEGLVYALAWTAAHEASMSVVEIDLAAAKVTAAWPVPLPVMEIVGLGSEIAFAPASGGNPARVIVMGNSNATDPVSPHLFGAVDVATGAWTQLATLPATTLWTFLGSFAAFSPRSRTMYTQLRNSTAAAGAGVFVHVDTGAVTLRTGCVTDNVQYDPATDSFITVGVMRNGTSIDDVWRVQMSIPADGSGDCTMGRVLYNEASAEGLDVVGVSAFDTAARQYWLFTGGETTPTSILRIGWDDGKLMGPTLATGARLPDTLLYLAAA